jgi:hypothetical protein
LICCRTRRPPCALRATTRFAESIQHLAERDIKPETWNALQLIATRGPALARDALSRALEDSRTLKRRLDARAARRLQGEGLIRGDAEVDLTDEGAALHRSLRDYIAASRARLLGRFDLADVETTVVAGHLLDQDVDRDRGEAPDGVGFLVRVVRVAERAAERGVVCDECPQRRRVVCAPGRRSTQT